MNSTPNEAAAPTASGFEIGGPILLTPRRHADARGDMSETFRQDQLDRLVGRRAWVQENHSRSLRRGVVRGLHLQAPPWAQAKLVRCIRGDVLDVGVDVRAGSPTFGRCVRARLSAVSGAQLFLPEGFLHGFSVLSDGAEVLYKCSAYYSPPHERGVRFDDPALAIDWELEGLEPILSPKDAGLGSLAAFEPMAP